MNNDEVKISDETSEETETSENVEEKKEDAVKSDKTEETILLPATTVSGNSVSAIAEAAIKGEDVSKPTVVKTEKNIEEAVSDKVTKLEEKVIETTMSAAEMEVLRAANMTDEERRCYLSVPLIEVRCRKKGYEGKIVDGGTVASEGKLNAILKALRNHGKKIFFEEICADFEE